MMEKTIRVRFAPSPTGYLHVGGARTALFNYLFARHNNGVFILRIEDTDQSRYQESACKEIFDSLKWLGIEWDEGPDVGGDYGPYVQSERRDIYKQYAGQLVESGNAYPCFCSPERLQKVREKQQAEKQKIGYDRHCRSLSESERRKLLEKNTPCVIRLNVPLGKTVVFNDAVRGEITYESDQLDDLVLLKTDGFPTYHLANVVDDHLMKISHVLRGDEWIASTPRHILLYEAFGWTPPEFAHMPVILSSDGGKLSKRKGAASVLDYCRAGYLPEALLNFLSLLGWAPGDDREIMNKEEIFSAFSLQRVSPKASVFDEKKLEWMNGQYMAQRSVESIKGDIIQGWKEKGFIDRNADENDEYLEQVIALMKDRSKKITDCIDNSFYFFKDPEGYDEKAAKKHFKPDAAKHLQVLCDKIEASDIFTQESLENIFREYAEKAGVSGGKLIHPTRLAVSGVSFGPGLFELLEALGKETVAKRMHNAISWIKENKS
ncbi:MAG: glutamate--tRNA ligase [Chitinivibrionales bacterium]|nr:glutamate--tRNA ligase [Chitinivibrionales bacterium]